MRGVWLDKASDVDRFQPGIPGKTSIFPPSTNHKKTMPSHHRLYPTSPTLARDLHSSSRQTASLVLSKHQIGQLIR